MADKQGSARDAGQKGEQLLGEDPSPAVYVGAALTGAGNAVEKKMNDLGESAQKAFEPGDMRIENAPHPVDALQAGVRKLAEPGDMNLAHAPHPVDGALADAKKKIEEIKAVDSVEGTLIGASAVVTAVIENVGPGKKIELVTDLADDARDIARHGHGAGHQALEGEVLPKGDGNGMELHQEAYPGYKERQALRDSILPEQGTQLSNMVQQGDLQAKPMTRVAEAIKHPLETVVRHFASAEEVLLNEAHKSKPGLLDRMDARHHSAAGAEEHLLDEQDRRMARAKAMGEALKHHPEMEALVKGMDTKAIRALINDDQFDERLGLGPMQRRLPQPENAELREAINNLHTSKSHAEDRARAQERLEARQNMGQVEKVLDFLKANITSPGGAKGSQYDVDRLAMAEKDSDVIKTIARGIGEKYVVGKAIVGAAMAGALYEAASDDEKAAAKLTPEQRLAEVFEKTAGSAKAEKETLKTHPELKPVYDRYHQAVEAATRSHPHVGGQVSSEASGEIYRAKKELMNEIREGSLGNKDLRSSADALTPEQKVAAAAQFIQSLPEHQRGAYQERVAEYANKAGVAVAETHQMEQSPEQAHQQAV